MIIKFSKSTGHRKQSPRASLASRINWFKFQLLGAYGHFSGIGYDILKHPAYNQLKPEVQQQLEVAILRARNAASELKDVVDKIADLNSPDKWIN